MSISPETRHIQLRSFRSLPDLTNLQEVHWSKRRVEKQLCMKEIDTEGRIAKVIVDRMCYQMNPCLHRVTLVSHTGKKSTKQLFANEIIKKYMCYLDISIIMHLKSFVPPEFEGIVLKKIKELTVNLDTVSVIRSTGGFCAFKDASGNTRLKPVVGNIDALFLRYIDGSIKELECRSSVDVVKYFGKYLDKDSRYDPEIRSLVDIYAGFSEEQIIEILKEVEAKGSIEDVLSRYCIALGTYYTWCSKYSGLLPEIKKVKKLEEENRKIKQMLAEIEINITGLKGKLLLFKNSFVKDE
ncbi:transposase [Candidatus Rhabdochlamydia porcellionis]|jgi:putative transposase|uniref:Uncharacterized protein n=1 Tax=Candidatus Rhabdochlamydia porcellionis TaxID=225148 RepID=A0ABX8Z3T7_9BACT|nr:transposase [Candidatus Rhabdochlamydia porcellionis]QZA58736.1 hypothetical protein RHAB15C_0000615 [Candidatus Rhabdochlamydia porcellionis]